MTEDLLESLKKRVDEQWRGFGFLSFQFGWGG